MNRSGINSIILLWLVAITASLLAHSWIVDLCAAALALICGASILVADPRTQESAKFGYKPIGITLMLSGVLIAGIALYRRFILI